MTDVVLIALASTFLWVLASQLHTPVIYPVQRWLRKGWRRPLTACAWCSGWWLSVVLTGIVQWGRWDWITTPITILASAALIGLVGSNLTPGIEDEDTDAG